MLKTNGEFLAFLFKRLVIRRKIESTGTIRAKVNSDPMKSAASVWPTKCEYALSRYNTVQLR